MDLPSIQTSARRGFDSPLSRTSLIRPKLNNISRTPDLINPFNVSKIKLGKHFLLYKELSRIEEEHDLKKANQVKMYRDFEDEKTKQQEIKSFEGLLEDVISCILLFDKRIGKILSKAWGCYIKAVNKGVKVKVEENLKIVPDVREKNRNKNKGIQVEENFMGHSEEYSKYMDMIRRALFKIDTLNHDKLVRELERLAISLTPKEIIYYSEEESSIEGEEKAKFEVQEIEEKRETILHEFKVEKKTLKSVLEKETQTNNPKDENSIEILNHIINERDKTIFHLRQKIEKSTVRKGSNSKEETEAVDNPKQEIPEKNPAQSPNNKTKKEEIKKVKEKYKKFKEELEAAQEDVENNKLTIKKNEVTISELSGSLQDLEKKIMNMRTERKDLELKLLEEIKARESIEKKFKEKFIKSETPADQKIKIYKKSTTFNKDSETDKIVSRDSFLNPGLDRISNTPIMTQDILENPFNPHFERLMSTENFRVSVPGLTPERITVKSFVGIKTPKLTKKKLSTISTTRIGVLGKRLMNKNNVYKFLNISKEEFLSLPKQIRLELFEALYEHKDKCGPECEHLKKAYQIKEKEKGKLYPLKKYNIAGLNQNIYN